MDESDVPEGVNGVDERLSQQAEESSSCPRRMAADSTCVIECQDRLYRRVWLDPFDGVPLPPSIRLHRKVTRIPLSDSDH